MKIPSGLDVVPMSFGSETKELDRKGGGKVTVTENTFDLDKWREKMRPGIADFRVSEVDLLPVYNEKAKGKQTKTKLSGMIVPDDQLEQAKKEGLIDYKYMAFLKPTRKDDVSVYVPLDQIKSKVSSKIKDWDKISSDMEQRKNEYLGSNNEESKPKELSLKQLKLDFDFGKMTDDEIREFYKKIGIKIRS